MFKQLRPVFMVFLLLTVVTGIVYPLLVTGVAQLAFPEKANGSLIRKEGGYAGSELIGQPFDDPKYFWGRLSATPDFPYNSASSSGSNLGPSNPALVEAVKARVEAFQKADPEINHPFPSTWSPLREVVSIPISAPPQLCIRPPGWHAPGACPKTRFVTWWTSSRSPASGVFWGNQG